MSEEKKEVAIDTDFFRKVTEYNVDGKLFLVIMKELEVQPVMHKYVYEYELGGNSTAKELVNRGLIRVYDYGDYLPKEKSGYEKDFQIAYKAFNFKVLKKNIYTYHHEKESLGEVRTALMAFHMGIDLLLSDDREAKQYITKNVSNSRHPIAVLNIYDTLLEIGKKNNRSMKWSEVKGLAKRLFTNKNKYNLLNQVWHK